MFDDDYGDDGYKEVEGHGSSDEIELYFFMILNDETNIDKLNEKVTKWFRQEKNCPYHIYEIIDEVLVVDYKKDSRKGNIRLDGTYKGNAVRSINYEDEIIHVLKKFEKYIGKKFIGGIDGFYSESVDGHWPPDRDPLNVFSTNEEWLKNWHEGKISKDWLRKLKVFNENNRFS